MVLLHLLVGLNLSLCDMGFADNLAAQKDFYRAITEYKRVRYYCAEDSIQTQCLLQIARCYRRSGRFRESAIYSTTLLAKSGLFPADLRNAYTNLGLTYLDTHTPQLATTFFQKALALDSSQFGLLCLGAAYVETRQLDTAAGIFDHAANRSTDGNGEEFLRISQAIRQHQRLPRKSGFKASLMSTVIPGSGQIYSRHYYDGVQAFLYTASFAFATYAAYRFEQSRDKGYSLSYIGIGITSVFHLGNIIGANRTAHYRNWKMDSDLYDTVRSEIESHDAR